MTTLKKILYVEDEPDIQAIAKLALGTIGNFDVVICSSGREAIEIASEVNPDLLLLDVMMPDLDGPETLNKLRQIDSLKETPALFLTANAMTADLERYIEAGAMDVIAKPFDPMTLSEQILKIWSEHDC